MLPQSPTSQPYKLTVVYPLDPLGPKVGGSVTFIRGLLQHAPPEIDLRFVGVTCDAARRPPLHWTRQQLDGRAFQFFPVLHEAREDQRHWVPLSLRFVVALAKGMVPDDGALLVHNRLETLLGRGIGGHRNIAFIHNDVPAQVDAGSSEVLWSRFPWLYHRFERLVFRRLDQVYTVSGNTLKDCRRRYPESHDKFAFVPTWVDTTRFAPGDASQRAAREALIANGLTLDADAPWLLYVGRLQPQKAPQRLLDAFALLLRRRPRARLVIVGDGNLRGEVEQRIERQGLAGAVRLLSPMPQSELCAYYRAADALVLASDFEGMPMCVLEALACGLPVATTRVGEVERVVRPGITGEIAESADAQGVCDAIVRLLDRLGSDVARDCESGCQSDCLDAIRPYSPHEVLTPIYARFAELAREAAHPG